MREKKMDSILKEILVILPVLNKRFLREDELFKVDDLYPSHIQILILLSNHSQLTMSQISREIHVINSNLTPLVDRLIKLKFLEREPSEKDRRVVYISLTNEGRQKVKDHQKMAKKILHERLEALSDEQVEELYHHVMGISKLLNICVKSKEF